MPILHELIAACDGCDHTQAYAAEVRHKGEPNYDSLLGYTSLAASDVEHDVKRLPLNWSWERQPGGKLHVLCPNCNGTT